MRDSRPVLELGEEEKKKTFPFEAQNPEPRELLVCSDGPGEAWKAEESALGREEGPLQSFCRPLTPGKEASYPLG